MPHPFEVTVLYVEEVHTLPSTWTNDDLRTLLEMAEMDDLGQVDDADLLDMVLMTLQDLGNQKAGELVLEAVFGDAMRPGVRQNMVDDLQQDEPWEDYAVVHQQRGLFVAIELLEKAFPNRYRTPEALRVSLRLRASSGPNFEELKPADPAWLVRALACGMSDTDVLFRLYEEEIAAGPFEDAAGIIWHREELEPAADDPPHSKRLAIIAPHMWLDPLRKGQVFQASVRSRL